MRNLDTQAVESAYLAANAQAYCGFMPLLAALKAYRQAECKPFKDALTIAAIREGLPIEVFNADTNQPYWKTVVFWEDTQFWNEYPAMEDWWPHESCLKWWTHYRIPFNPEEG